ncbi:MAG: endonuclease III [Candidatus Bilamarchaeaceae archaeon]
MNILKNISVVLGIMEKEAKKRKAPVFAFKKKTKNNAFKLLIATILSSRTKDEKTIQAIDRLFAFVSKPSDLAGLPIKKIEKLIYGVGFYRVKAKNIKKTSELIVKKFNGKVPSNLNGLLELPGVGRKVANIVLSEAYRRRSIPVDTHVHRISNRLGLVNTKNPAQTERELLKIIPKKYINNINHIFVAYGQTICLPRMPFCSICKIRRYCAKKGVSYSR